MEKAIDQIVLKTWYYIKDDGSIKYDLTSIRRDFEKELKKLNK